MSLSWQCVIVDCADPEPVATFWQAALGWRRTHISADGGEIVLEPPEGSPEDGVCPDLLFIRVPEAKTAKAVSSRSLSGASSVRPDKNRLHLDLRPRDQAAEVDRLTALGATRADIGQEEG